MFLHVLEVRIYLVPLPPLSEMLFFFIELDSPFVIVNEASLSQPNHYPTAVKPVELQTDNEQFRLLVVYFSVSIFDHCIFTVLS